MLKDQEWQQVSVHRVVADFIRGEPHYWQPNLPAHRHHLVHEPDLESGIENAARWRLLYSYRRYLMGEIPPDTRWYEVHHLEDEHLAELLVISRCGFFEGPPYDLPSVSRDRDISLQTPVEDWPPPVLWGHDRSGPFTILEGNHRLTAYARNPTHSLRIPCYVGMSAMPCFWHAIDPPHQLVYDMWRQPPGS